MMIILRILILHLLLNASFYTVTQGQNLITNPGFEEGLTGWANNLNNGASANFTIETLSSPEGNNHVKAEVLTLGINAWDVQLRSNEFPVDESHNYRLSFLAKSATPGTELKVYIQKNAWMGKNFTLSDSWESYSYEFFPNEAVKQLKFNMVELDSYYIDSIVLEDISPDNSAFNTPPVCVITTPHVNAYYSTGNQVVINAYATDIGGSGQPGEIASVDFYVDDLLIGTSSSSLNNTYSWTWNTDTEGEFRINSVATDTLGKSFTSAGVLIKVGSDKMEKTGLSAEKGKYLGNLVRNSGVEPSFTDYWNAVTSGNGGKWKTVEKTRDVMDWQIADEAYKLALDNHLPYRYHTLAWGNQYPDWITTLNPAEFQAEMEEFISAIANRYPYIDQIDVINEALPGHQEDTQYFIDGLGGAGESGFDWAVWLFKKAREYFPDSKLVLNDFGMVSSSSHIREQLLLIKVLRDSALIDGFGAQAHTFSLDGMLASELQENLDLMATAGIPIYITEMDMQGVNTDEASQLISYQNLFPVLWEHTDVAGITLWGYIYGDMWKPDAGLIYDNLTERSSMNWLKNYMNEQENVGYPFAEDTTLSLSKLDAPSKNPVRVYQDLGNEIVNIINFSESSEQIHIYDISGRMIDSFELHASSSAQRKLSKGIYIVYVKGKVSMKLLVK